jgi:hypothetical protein
MIDDIAQVLSEGPDRANRPIIPHSRKCNRRHQAPPGWPGKLHSQCERAPDPNRPMAREMRPARESSMNLRRADPPRFVNA